MDIHKTIMFHFEKMTRATKNLYLFRILDIIIMINQYVIAFESFEISYKMKNLIILLCGKNVIIKTINLVVSYLRWTSWDIYYSPLHKIVRWIGNKNNPPTSFTLCIQLAIITFFWKLWLLKTSTQVCLLSTAYNHTS